MTRFFIALKLWTTFPFICGWIMLLEYHPTFCFRIVFKLIASNTTEVLLYTLSTFDELTFYFSQGEKIIVSASQVDLDCKKYPVYCDGGIGVGYAFFSHLSALWLKEDSDKVEVLFC